MKKTKNPTAKECLQSIGYALAIFLTIMLLALISITTQAQNVVRQGKVFIEQVDTLKRGKMYNTDYTYKDKDGKIYPIYLSSGGNAFIVKISKKSGKQYRKYLPEVTKQITNKQ